MRHCRRSEQRCVSPSSQLVRHTPAAVPIRDGSHGVRVHRRWATAVYSSLAALVLVELELGQLELNEPGALRPVVARRVSDKLCDGERGAVLCWLRRRPTTRVYSYTVWLRGRAIQLCLGSAAYAHRDALWFSDGAAELRHSVLVERDKLQHRAGDRT